MASFQWKLNKKEHFKKKTVLTPTLEHPLRNSLVTERISRKFSQTNELIDTLDSVKNYEMLDPLTELALRDMDPLKRMQIENLKDELETTDGPFFNPTELWNNKKSFILNKYTTSNKISIISSYLADGDKIVMKNAVVVDKVQNRLEQLDCCEETSQRKMELTQTEYMNRIDMLNKELRTAWTSEQRVKAVKIAIQCAKLLADTDVMSFYPSKFVLITEILDTFGHFVYDRLKHMAETKPGSNKTVILPDNFTPEMIPDSAKETCFNWFYKVASIRELVPRLYVELAFIRSYNFISSTEAYDALLRITKMINGVGNPLVAVYIRCYLCKVALSLPYQTNNSYALENLKCFIGTYQHLFSENVKDSLKKEELALSKYLDLFSPALEFIMEIIIMNASDKTLDEIFKECSKNKISSLILNTIISVFKPHYVANKTVEFLEMIGQTTENDYPISILLCSLGHALGKCPPPIEQRKPILRNIGKYSDSFRSLDEYICYVEAWMPFIAKNFKVREINAMLGDIISRVSKKKNNENYIHQLKKIMRIVTEEVEDFETLFTSDNFLPFLDLFQQDSIKVEVCKTILELLCTKDIKISDPIVASAFAFLCTILHDSVDALTPEDEHKQIGQIICNVLRKVDFGRDFEQQLNFYVEARGSFSNIDSVLIELIQSTNTLMIKTRNIMQGFHNRKTADFIRACAAYCFITIPSISSPKARLELYLLSAQVAYFNQCLGQADACIRAVLNIFSDHQIRNKDVFLISYIKKILSTLLVTPDNPDVGVLSFFRSLLNILQKYEWEDDGVAILKIYLSVLDVLSIMGHETLPYHIDKVESNDVLYGNDEKFVQEIDKICTIILKEILIKLKEFGSCRKQSALMLDLFVCILNRCDLNEPSVLKLASNLWQQTSKNGYIEKKFMENIKKYYISKGIKTNNENLKRLIVNLS